MELSGLGRVLMILGIVIFALGALLALSTRAPWIGRLPGDFVFGGAGWKVYLPLGTTLVISVILSIVLSLLLRRR